VLYKDTYKLLLQNETKRLAIRAYKAPESNITIKQSCIWQPFHMECFHIN